MGEVFVPYPTLDASVQDNNSPRTPDDAQATPQAQSSASADRQRRHAACDECRERKLKCSGEPGGCSRCSKRGIPCVYSQQKQMGRPRKRQKMDDETRSNETSEARHTTIPPRSIQPQVQIESQPETPIDPSLANIDHDLTNFQNVCSAPMAQTIRGQRCASMFGKQLASDSDSLFQSDNNVPSPDQSYTQYPTDIALWPDFSTLETLPLPLTTKFDARPTSLTTQGSPSSTTITHSNTTYSYQDPDVDPSALASLPSIPACPCLPNLYLSLSTLSTLSSFPVSQQTIDSLVSAHKTAHSVIYCPVCPREYQSGSQNLMLGCTLLNVLADHWHRMRNATPEDLRKGFTSSNNNTPTQSFISVKEGNAWRKFIRQVVRAYVFGDTTIPTPPTESSLESTTITTTDKKVSESNTLTYLIAALERRQRQWHQLDDPTDEFPDRTACEYTPGSRGHDHAAAATGKSHRNVPSPRVSRRRRSSETAETGMNGDDGATNGDGGEEVEDRNGHEEAHGDGHQHDHPGPYVCLLLVRHAKDIVEALQKDAYR